jgi:hypothetical protein
MRDRLRARITIADGDQRRFHQDLSAVRALLNKDTDEDEATSTSSDAPSTPIRQVRRRILGPNDEPPSLSLFKDEFATKARRLLLHFESPLLRYRFLIIIGDSRTGKSQFALQGLQFRMPYVCEGGFDMAGFRANLHDAIVFNDVAIIGHIILKYKALFQGTSIPTTVAESTTSMHSYKVTIIITITMNRSSSPSP